MQIDEIRIPVGAVQRSDFPQGQILKADVRRASLDRNIAVQAAVGIAVDGQLARPGNALNLCSGRLVDFTSSAGQIDNYIRAEKAVVDCLDRIAQGAEVGVAGAGIFCVSYDGCLNRHGSGAASWDNS